MNSTLTDTFHDALLLVREADVPVRRKRDIVSAFTRTAEMLSRQLKNVPADPPRLRPLLREIRPAAHGITWKTLSNIRSLLAAGLAIAGTVDPLRRGMAKRDPAWGALVSAISARKDLSTGLATFASWCAREQIAPSAVSDAIVQRFLVWIETRTLHQSPRDLVRALPNLWRRAGALVEQWPDTQLARLSFRRPSKRLAWHQLSDSLQEEVQTYITNRRSPNIFDETGRVPRRPLAESTVRQHSEHLRLAASILINEGHIPTTQVLSLSDLVTPKAVKVVLGYYHGEAGAQPSAFVACLANTLLQVAQYHTGASEQEIKQLKLLIGRLPKVPFDLTSKNKLLLRQLEPKHVRAKLLFLPDELLKEVVRDWKRGRYRVVDAQVAIAVDILLAVPLRPQNLSSLHWRQHFQVLGASDLLLHIPATETKTRQSDLIADIPADTARRLLWYRRVVLPVLKADPNGHLFVNRHGTLKHQKTLAGQIIDTISRHVGIHMTPHQFRHFAAVSYLEAHPEDFETVRAALGHAAAKSTRVYAGSSSRRAGRAYGKFLFAARDSLRLHRPRKMRRHTLKEESR